MNYNTAKVAFLGRNDLERALVEVTERGMGEGNLGSRGKCKKKTYPQRPVDVATLAGKRNQALIPWGLGIILISPDYAHPLPK